jgi:hypothetical protein
MGFWHSSIGIGLKLGRTWIFYSHSNRLQLRDDREPQSVRDSHKIICLGEVSAWSLFTNTRWVYSWYTRIIWDTLQKWFVVYTNHLAYPAKRIKEHPKACFLICFNMLRKSTHEIFHDAPPIHSPFSCWTKVLLSVLRLWSLRVRRCFVVLGRRWEDMK